MPKSVLNSTGLELVLNACEGELQVLLTEDSKLVCSQAWAVNHRETEVLAPALEQMFALSGRKISNLRRILCVRGPGSFTGIRLVLATAAALRRCTRAQVGAVDYMQALATTASFKAELLYDRKIWVATHARRGLVHLCRFRSFGPVIPSYAMDGIRLVGVADALSQIQAGVGGASLPEYVVGSALSRSKELLDGVLALEAEGRCVALPRLVSPSFEALRILGRHGDYFKKDVEPLYVRPCDAVENLPDLAGRMGGDGATAVAELEGFLSMEPKSSI